jgi:molybdopterin/thiamine biosynthesis adenylyltransferase/rhodanese-related sulfurtransferase
MYSWEMINDQGPVAPSLQELSADHFQQAIEQRSAPSLVIDVRQPEEYQQGHLPGARLIPLSQLTTELAEQKIAKDQPLFLYCAVGQRSARGAEQLLAAGYRSVAHLHGGLAAWQAAGRELSYPPEAAGLSPEQRQRYSRQLLLPEIGLSGQRQLLDSRVLLIGAGGLGSPAALYLAAAGVGTIGLVDDDLVEASNLQRQVIHRQQSVGQPKTASGAETLQALNPDIQVNEHRQRLVAANIGALLDDYQLIIDGSDNFPTRYLLNDWAWRYNRPLISAAILGFSGQLTTIIPGAGPCYRCLYPQPPPPELAPSCSANGILGVVAGTFGILQASEALKVLLAIGQPLVGRLLLADLLTMEINTLRFAADPNCALCRPGAPDLSWDDQQYQQFCTSP